MTRSPSENSWVGDEAKDLSGYDESWRLDDDELDDEDDFDERDFEEDAPPERD